METLNSNKKTVNKATFGTINPENVKAAKASIEEKLKLLHNKIDNHSKTKDFILPKIKAFKGVQES